MKQQVIHIGERKQKLIILSPKSQTKPLPGILWIHGGGYMIGMASMVHMSAARIWQRSLVRWLFELGVCYTKYTEKKNSHGNRKKEI